MSSVPLKPAQWFDPRSSLRITAYAGDRSVLFEGPGRRLALVSIHTYAREVRESLSFEIPVRSLPAQFDEIAVYPHEIVLYSGQDTISVPIEPCDPVQPVMTEAISRALPINHLRTVAACADKPPFYRILSHIKIDKHGMTAANGFVACRWRTTPFMPPHDEPVLLNSESVRKMVQTKNDYAWIVLSADKNFVGTEFDSKVMGRSTIRLLDRVRTDDFKIEELMDHLTPKQYEGRLDLSFLRKRKLTDRTLVVSEQMAFLLAPDGTIEAVDLADVPSEWTLAIEAERLSPFVREGRFEIGWNGKANPVGFRNFDFTFLVMPMAVVPPVVWEAETADGSRAFSVQLA